MDMTYVPSWLIFGEREIDGWPKFVSAEQRTWLVDKVTEFVTKHGPRSIQDIVYWVFRMPDSPRWVVIDAQYAAVHRALLQAGFEQVWTKPASR